MRWWIIAIIFYFLIIYAFEADDRVGELEDQVSDLQQSSETTRGF